MGLLVVNLTVVSDGNFDTFSIMFGVTGSGLFSKGQQTFTFLSSNPQIDFLRKSVLDWSLVWFSRVSNIGQYSILIQMPFSLFGVVHSAETNNTKYKWYCYVSIVGKFWLL